MADSKTIQSISDRSVIRAAVGQLTLIEHCLCPLDARVSLQDNFVHETSFAYSKNKQRKKARVRVSCPGGLSTEDEFFLWGLLSLTLSQPKPSADFHATRHYCLRQLGKIDSRRRGGRQYQQLAESLERLSLVSYRNDAFYDPIRSEHRRVSFGFLSYSLPLDEESSRTWHIAWDPIFFGYCMAARSVLAFDFEVYSELDAASRRLFLFLHKMFWRYRATPPADVRELGTNVLGFSDSLRTTEIRVRIRRAAERLRERGIIAGDCQFLKQSKGQYSVRFAKGTYFNRKTERPMANRIESTLNEPLRSIGFAEHEVQRILHKFAEHLVQQWSDVTLAALEHKGRSFFKRSPQAFFMHNIQQAALGTRTPPDWWVELRKRETLAQANLGDSDAERETNEKPSSISDVLAGVIEAGLIPSLTGDGSDV
jgi:hypothetical protein